MTPHCVMGKRLLLLESHALVVTNPLEAMYNLTIGTTNVTGNQLGIFEDLDETFAQSTLKLFWKTFSP